MDKIISLKQKSYKQYGSQKSVADLIFMCRKGEFTDCLEETEPEKRPL